MSTTLGSRNRTPRRRTGGFTLIEIMIVVLLLGIVTAVGVPVLTSSADNARVSSAAGQVAAALDFAKQTAASGGRPCRVTIDAAADTLAVQ